MNCHEVEMLLPGHLEDLLSTEEKKIVEDHLDACPHCRRSFEDLLKTEKVLNQLKEVEPPPFFEQRIMARVREEAGRKKGLLQRLFYPLSIKVPIQAMTTVLVVVLAIYLFQKNEPEIKYRTSFPALKKEAGKEPETTKPSTTSSKPRRAPLIKRAPIGDLQKKDQESFAASPQGQKIGEEKRTEPFRSRVDEHPASAQQSPFPSAVKEKEVPLSAIESLEKGQTRLGKQESDKALEPSLTVREQKRELTDSRTTTGVGEVMKSSPAPSGLSAASILKWPIVGLTIQTQDPAQALSQIEALMAQIKARIIEKGLQEGRGFLKAETSGQDINEVLKRLEAVGSLSLEKNELNSAQGKAILNIKIVPQTPR